MGSQIVHFEILGRNGAQLRDFYRQMFDWTFQVDESNDYGLVDGAGLNGGIGSAEMASVRVFVATDDLKAELEKAERLGGKTTMEPTDVGMAEIALFSDPEGNTVGLVKPKSSSG